VVSPIVQAVFHAESHDVACVRLHVQSRQDLCLVFCKPFLFSSSGWLGKCFLVWSADSHASLPQSISSSSAASRKL